MLQQLLQERHEEILERWLELILQTYPEASTKFLERTNDQFGNPVGHTLKNVTEQVFRGLLRQAGTEELGPVLEQAVRVRAVQDFSPSQAVLFVFLLKKSLREILADHMSAEGVATELLTFEVEIDRLVMVAFDLYMESRQRLFDIRVNEIRNRTRMLEERLNRTEAAASAERGNSNDDQ